jgi:hypothetical protein
MVGFLHRARKAAAVTLAVCGLAVVTLGLPAGATQPGAKGQIVFMRVSQVGTSSQVFAVNADGTGLHLLSVPDQVSVFPTFFADGSKIGCMVGDVGYVVMNPDGSDKHALPGVQIGGYSAAASPDGTHILWMGYDGLGHTKVDTMNFDGSDQRTLFPDSGDGEWSASWSPDSKRIAYVRYSSAGLTELWVSDSDGLNPRLVTTAPNASTSAAGFSPDGHSLVFSENKYLGDGGYETHLYIVSDMGGDLHEIGALPNGGAYSPNFSPDGQSIVFSLGGPEHGIYTASLDGTHVERLTSGDDEAPDWQPITAASLPTTTSSTTSSTSTSTTSTSTTSTTTVAANAAPRAVVTLATSGRSLQVSGARSTDNDGTIGSYQWFWGDKTTAVTTKAATHSYASAGTYRVILVVTDNKGARNSTEVWVHVA